MYGPILFDDFFSRFHELLALVEKYLQVAEIEGSPGGQGGSLLQYFFQRISNLHNGRITILSKT